MKLPLNIVLLLLVPLFTTAQVWPQENDTIHYRMVGFIFPTNAKASYYKLEIARGINNNNTYFNKNIIQKSTTQENRQIQTVPAFGQSYTWRITYLNHKKKATGQSPLYHFTTGAVNLADTSRYRLKILANEMPGKDLWILSDGNKCMYNLDGEPIWYLPPIPGVINADDNIRDLKITNHNTITFLSGNGCFEIDYDANILWQTPPAQKTAADGSAFFHHEFTRLSNGHYMVAGKEYTEQQLPPWADTTSIKADNDIFYRNGNYYKKIIGGTLLEYDSNSKIVWQLPLHSYFSTADYFSKQLPSGKYISETHFNSFCFDEKNHIIYLSFRNADRVLKISYPEGKLLCSYNGTATSGKQQQTTFRAQHCVRANETGNISLLNNGSKKGKTGVSSVVIFKEDTAAPGNIALQWEFPCDIDTLAAPNAEAGGSVYRIDGNKLLVAMGTAARIFIVSREKNILWNAVGQVKRNDIWVPQAQYRASPVQSFAQLEKLIFFRKKI